MSSQVPVGASFPGYPSMPQQKPAMLDGPPPAPGQPQFSPGSPGGEVPLPTAGQDPQQVLQEGLRAVSEMVLSLDRTLLVMAQSMPDGAEEFGQARELINAGVRKYVQSNVSQVGDAGMLPSATPTETGPQFPGGGFDSGQL